MSFYFTMGDLFGELERAGDAPALQALIPVSKEPPAQADPSDVFVFSAAARILDLDREDAVQKLTALLAEIPLYQVNMELALDEALTERHRNATLRRALEIAFTGEAMPSTLHSEEQGPGEMKGGLRHPMLGHVEPSHLCALYLAFLNALGPGRQDYSFERNITGAQAERFATFYDGYIHKGAGRLRADMLLESGMRRNHDPARPLESYMQGGREEAAAMNVTDPRELVWAWIEADACQMRRCADIHRLKQMSGLRNPGWIRTDIFALLQKEAMKQTFAENLAAADPGLSLLRAAPLLRKAIQSSAEGQVDEMLQQLLAQTLNVDAGYAGSAGKFADTALRRQQEARQQKLV